MTKEEITKSLTKALLGTCSAQWDAELENVKTVLNLIEIIIAAHLSSLSCQLLWAITLSDKPNLESEMSVRKIVNDIIESLNKNGFQMQYMNDIKH